MKCWRMGGASRSWAIPRIIPPPTFADRCELPAEVSVLGEAACCPFEPAHAGAGATRRRGWRDSAGAGGAVGRDGRCDPWNSGDCRAAPRAPESANWLASRGALGGVAVRASPGAPAAALRVEALGRLGAPLEFQRLAKRLVIRRDLA